MNSNEFNNFVIFETIKNKRLQNCTSTKCEKPSESKSR
jgi:hypothetical protein